MRLAALLAALVLALLGSQATAAAHGAAAVPLPVHCPFGVTYADGCSLGPVGVGSATGGTYGVLYQNTNWFTLAKLSGQGSYFSAPGVVSMHPPPWNLAGVDYPVGIPDAKAANLKDPSTDSFPVGSGCAYQLSGGPSNNPYVLCNGNSNGLTLDGWDFSANNSCIWLHIGKNYTGTIRVTNSKFSLGPTCEDTQTAFSAFAKVDVGSKANIYFAYNYMQGGAKPLNDFSRSEFYFDGTPGSITIEYNAVFYPTGQDFATATTGPIVIRYNYFEGLTTPLLSGNNELHGGVLEGNFASGTTPLRQFSFNTGLIPDSAQISGTTTFFNIYGPTCSPSGCSVYTEGLVDHNTTITNTNMHSSTIAASVSWLQQSVYNNQQYLYNYTDPTGAFGAFEGVEGTAAITGKPGTGTVGSTVSGNILTVGDVNFGLVAVGQTVTGTGIVGKPHIIAPLGGSQWQFDGPPQATLSARMITMTQRPFCTVPAKFMGNVNMLNGSTITTWFSIPVGSGC